MKEEAEVRWCKLCDAPVQMSSAMQPVIGHHGRRGTMMFTDGKVVHVLLSSARTAIKMRSIERKKQTYIVRLVEQVLATNPEPTTAQLVAAMNTPAEQV